MINKLTQLIKSQNEDLKQLSLLLKVQQEMIMKKDAFGLEQMVEQLGACSKKIAQVEVQRRNLIGNNSLNEIIIASKDENLRNSHKEIQKTLSEVTHQKETNEMLLKQGIQFNMKMLNIMNPSSRDIKTYNSYGNLTK